MEGFRTDVIIANSSLIESRPYRELIREGTFGAIPLQYDLPELPTEEDAAKVWLVNTRSDKSSISPSEFVKELEEEVAAHGVPQEPYFLPNITVLIPPPDSLTADNSISAMWPETAEWNPFDDTH